MKKKYLILISICGFIIALDQLTKMYVHTHFLLGESLTIFPDFFDITYVRNEGAAFGIFRESADTFRNIFFLTMPPVAVVFIIYILHGINDDDRVQNVALSLVCGGAIGNYIDRLRFRYVIDFLDFHFERKWTYPAFNIADSAIVVGIGILMYLMFIQWQEEKKQKTQIKT
ncbi:MAG: signal peptidase II [Bdellovibrionaceae bacterium]|nr:signal peptidase II [Pseudobdellovibrionaceae bacterium]